MHNNRLNSQTVNELNNLRNEMTKENTAVNQTLGKYRSRLDDYGLRIKALEDDISNLHKHVDEKTERLLRLDKEIMKMHDSKLSTDVAQGIFMKTAKKLRKVKQRNEEISNQQVSLENWIEKYLPLKLQHQITETVEPCVPHEMRERFIEISRGIAANLRKEIVQDTGNSYLKKKTLDLITVLRLERTVYEEEAKRIKL